MDKTFLCIYYIYMTQNFGVDFCKGEYWVIFTWHNFLRYWPFVMEIDQQPANFPHNMVASHSFDILIDVRLKKRLIKQWSFQRF